MPNLPLLANSFEGICSGGPRDGKNLASHWQRVTIPFVIDGRTVLGAGYYEFKAENQIWIWKGGQAGAHVT